MSAWPPVALPPVGALRPHAEAPARSLPDRLAAFRLARPPRAALFSLRTGRYALNTSFHQQTEQLLQELTALIRLVHAAVRKGSSIPAPEAEEIESDVFLDLVAHLGAGKGVTCWCALAVTIARRRRADWFRRQGRAANALRVPWTDRLADRGRHGDDLRSEVGGVEFADLWAVALPQMPGEVRAVFVAVYRDGLSTRQAADQLGCSWATANARLQEGLSIAQRLCGESTGQNEKG